MCFGNGRETEAGYRQRLGWEMAFEGPGPQRGGRERSRRRVLGSQNQGEEQGRDQVAASAQPLRHGGGKAYYPLPAGAVLLEPIARTF